MRGLEMEEENLVDEIFRFLSRGYLRVEEPAQPARPIESTHKRKAIGV
jgi:hypothetical protein